MKDLVRSMETALLEVLKRSPREIVASANH